MRKVFLDDLPKHKKGVNKGRTNWKESAGYVVKFIYDDLEGEIEIIEHKDSKLTLKYLDNIKKLYTNHFANCHIGKLIGTISSHHYLEVGKIVNTQNRELKIIGQIRLVPSNLKGYEYLCLKCTNKDKISEGDLKKGNGCNVCRGLKVLEGVNDIWTTESWMGRFLFDKGDGYKYTSKSQKEVRVKCPICKREGKSIPISRIYYLKGISCMFCSDGFTYPEKLYSVLEQLKLTFNYHKTFKWSQDKEYDFYISDLNCVIETHGAQHYRYTGRGRSLKEERENDKIKKKLAVENGIEHYIVIDCRESEVAWIKNSVVNNPLNKILDLSKVDWLKCHEFSLYTTLVKKVCDSFNEGLTSKEIRSTFKISSNTYRRYLKKGTVLGWCDYNPEEEKRENYKLMSKKIVQMTLEGDVIKIFASRNKAKRETGIHNLTRACTGKQETAGGYKWIYLEDYEKKHELVGK